MSRPDRFILLQGVALPLLALLIHGAALGQQAARAPVASR